MILRHLALFVFAIASSGFAQQPVWDLGKAHRETTPTRERVCINGVWRWQPADNAKIEDATIPNGGWGHFKVPGSWPGITDYMQKDSQTVHAHGSWKTKRLGDVTAAWQQREITIPKEWAGKRITLSAACVNSYAAVFIDNKRVGAIRFPEGEIDLTSVCEAGKTHVLSMLVLAMPLNAVMISHRDTAAATQVKGSVARRGLCGDVWLIAQPKGARVDDVRVTTSVRKGEITFSAAAEALQDKPHRLRARIATHVFTSAPLRPRDGRLQFTATWKPDRLWDLHTPANQHTAEVSLLADDNTVLDTAFPARFGFRELWIDGRDFYLNGTRIWLSAVPLDNAQIGAAWATYDGAKETFERLKTFGINFVYTHNYDCQPGAHLDFEQILRAADDSGMLVAISQPHFSQYDWQAADAEKTNGYAGHAAYYARVAANHPSVVFYSTSHNATGYDEDMNPDQIGRGEVLRDNWSKNNSAKALRAEAIIRRIDPSRIVYHHASGDLGSMHPMNFYLNFTPIQEMSDWFEGWAARGNKPAFMCEYGVPFTWDWTMYRGWYQGKREFGSAKVPWIFAHAEWNAQFLGDRAYAIGDAERANLRWEAKQMRAGNLWHRWDYPAQVGSSRFDDRYEVFAAYLTDNFRAFRTHGVSATSPWEHAHFWKLRDGFKPARVDLASDWEKLQRPGISPDYMDQRMPSMDVAYERNDWVATPAAKALIRNNRPLLAYIGGKPAAFTSKDHDFFPGQTVEKQLILINNSRRTVTADCEWSLGKDNGRRKVTIATGEQLRLPVRFELPGDLAPGTHTIAAKVNFGDETQEDSFDLHVLAPPAALPAVEALGLFDPAGQTATWLDKNGVGYRRVEAGGDLSEIKTLIVGKRAITVNGPVPDFRRVRDGLNVIVFEQEAAVLEKRFGFRVAEYGLRNAWPRIGDHPLLADLATEHLRDWAGEATLLPPRLKYELRPMHGPTVKWCGIDVSRAWRCGNRGNVASVLIEKPERGDFRPIVDGGYALQYSALMEYREGKGAVLFCQLDVTGRSEDDPAAQTLAANILRYAAQKRPITIARKVMYVGEDAGLAHLRAAGFEVLSFDEKINLNLAHVLVIGPGGGKILNDRGSVFWGSGGNMVATGLEQTELELLRLDIRTANGEHIAATFTPPQHGSLFAGISPADIHNRDPREISLVRGGANVLGGGVLAQRNQRNVILCQLAPWHFEAPVTENVRRTHRRVSFLLSRLLSNMGAAATTPLLERMATAPGVAETRYTDGLYLAPPREWDDPYRFFRW